MIQADFRHQPLEPSASLGTGTRFAQILIDHQHLLGSPAQRLSPISQPILEARGLLMIQHLLDGRLANVHDGEPFTMPGMELLRTQLIQGVQSRLDCAWLSKSSPSSLPSALRGSSWRSSKRLRSPSKRWRLGWGNCSHSVLAGLDVGGGELGRVRNWA